MTSFSSILKLALLALALALVLVLSLTQFRCGTADWKQVGSDVEDDFVGTSEIVSEDGTTFVVEGCTTFVVEGNRYCRGHLRVYKKDLSLDGYKQFDIEGEITEYTGYSLTISGDGTTFAVTACVDDEEEPDAFRVYQLSLSGNEYLLVGSDITVEDSTFISLCMPSDGTTIAIGAVNHAVLSSGFNMAHVRVYKVDSFTNHYQRIGSDINVYGDTLAISADGTIIAIGVPWVPYSGYVSVYTFAPDSGLYTQIGSEIYGESKHHQFGTYEQFGTGLSMSADGSTIAVSANQYVYDCIRCNSTGVVRVYKLDSFTNQYKQIGSDVVNGKEDVFCLTLSDDGATIAVNSDVYKYDLSDNNYKQIGSDRNGTAFALSADGTAISLGDFNNNSLSARRFAYMPEKCGLMQSYFSSKRNFTIVWSRTKYL